MYGKLASIIDKKSLIFIYFSLNNEFIRISRTVESIYYFLIQNVKKIDVINLIKYKKLHQ